MDDAITESIAIVMNPAPRHNKASAVSLNKLMTVLPSWVGRCYVASIGYDAGDFNAGREVVVSSKRPEGKLSRAIAAQLEACRLIGKATSPDVIFWIADAMILPFIYCKLHGKRVYSYVLYDWGYMRSRGGIGNKVRNAIRRAMALKADIVCVESKHVLDSWPEIAQKQTVLELPLFVESNLFSCTEPISSRRNTVCMVNRLASEKNVLQAMRGFEEFNGGHDYSWRLVIVGDGPLRGEVEATARCLNSDIEILGWRGRQEVAGILNSSKCILMPTMTEGLPNTLLEAMACGTPPIATLVGGIKGLLREETGIALEVPDEHCIASALDRFSQLDDAVLEALSESCIETVSKGYSLTVSKGKMERAICKR